MRKGGKRSRVPERLFGLRDQYVTLAGEIAAVAIEEDRDPGKIDHVWITVRAGDFGRLQISLNTFSRQNRAAGFDPRVRLGIITEAWNELPPPGLRKAAPLDYALLEAAHPTAFTVYERSALEEKLLLKARGAICAEAWGEFYIRSHVGVHQIHSRRASFAVPRDLIGHDGAVRFYFAQPHVSELLLFKFAGQP